MCSVWRHKKAHMHHFVSSQASQPHRNAESAGHDLCVESSPAAVRHVTKDSDRCNFAPECLICGLFFKFLWELLEINELNVSLKKSFGKTHNCLHNVWPLTFHINDTVRSKNCCPEGCSEQPGLHRFKCKKSGVANSYPRWKQVPQGQMSMPPCWARRNTPTGIC